MSDKKITYNEAIMRDKLLFELSMYDASGGMMRMFKSQEEFMEFSEKGVNFFNRYKRIIQNGEYTFEEIVDDIIARNAAVPRNLKKVNLDSDESVKEMFNTFEKNVENMEINSFMKEKFGIIQGILDEFPSLDKYIPKEDKKDNGDKDDKSKHKPR